MGQILETSNLLQAFFIASITKHVMYMQSFEIQKMA